MMWTCATASPWMPVRKNDIIVIHEARTRDGPKQTWMEAIKKDMGVVNLTMKMTLNKLNGRKVFM